jgi:cobalt/nickel transport system ATP-binding protein
MCDTILDIQDLCYSYPDGSHALRCVTLGIKRGQTTAILGGNGAGKSTLLLSLNGILKPSAGHILFKGVPLDYSRKGLVNLRKNVGIVFQDPDNQLFSASVIQDISFGAMNLKLPEAEVRRRVNTAMARTGISHLKNKPTHCLSFGQKKRIAIAGILVMEPEVLILDEPTAGLDPNGVSEIMSLLKETQKELGISIIISTHDIDIVPLYCDYAYVLNEGTKVMEGTPKEIFTKKDLLRNSKLRLPRIGHLMEILKNKDGFDLNDTASTISEARKALNGWRGIIGHRNKSLTVDDNLDNQKKNM